MGAPFLALVWRPWELRPVELPSTGTPDEVTERWRGAAPRGRPRPPRPCAVAVA